MNTMVLLVGDSRRYEEDDCACSHNLTGIQKQFQVDRLRLHAGGDAQKVVSLNSQFQVVACLDKHGSIAVIGPPGQRVFDAFANPGTVDDIEKRLVDLPAQQVTEIVRHLALLGFLQPAVTDCACVTEEDCGPAISPLTSWLHLTDRCNLRCDYCYLPHVREDMSPETGRAAIDATFRSALANGFKQVKFKYAGGESLLRFPLIVELHQYARTLADRHGLGLEGVILSNGTLLTPVMIETLKSLGLRLMISLDGLGAYHDVHRPYAGGRGSFADVAEAIDLALANGLVPNISVTISSRTAEGLPDVMAWILERELPFSLNFYRENDLSASHEDMQLNEEKIISGMLAGFKVIENNLPRRPFLGGIIDRANMSVSHTHTCGVGQNYLVFDQHGQIAKCQMHIRKPVADVHAADPLAVIRADQIGIQNISVEEKEGCKTCEWKYWCAGGCPLTTYRATGRYDVKSPNCNIYKALFPEALRLEGLRLLKYQDDPEVVQKIVV